MKTLVTYLTIVVLAAACGRKDERDADANNPEVVESGSQTVVGDTSVAAEAATSQLNASISDAAADTEESTATSLALIDNEVTSTRTCSAADGIVTVETSRSRKKSRDFVRAKREVHSSQELTGSSKRVWSKAGTSLACNTAKNRVSLANLNVAGLKLSLQYKGSVSQSYVNKNLVNGKEVSASRKIAAEGTRTAEWTSDSTASGVITRNRTVKGELKSTLEVKNASGKLISLGEKHAIKDSDPLIIEVTRDAATYIWKTKTIKSGTRSAVYADGSKGEQSYSNVKFTAADMCAPVSGSVSGKIYESETATEAKLSYKIEFTDGVATLTYGDGSQKEINLDGCDLEANEDAVE